MTTPRMVYLTSGTEISLDPNRTPGGQPLLQFALSDGREYASEWRCVLDLTPEEATELRDHLDRWIESVSA